ncbi:MAG: polysaccharide biosynthesis C-terminal domain-containing protein [Kiritimatiellaeota bacterium]|nr:polysaccharide biosynthesis C-terminal domain-containing protein [Kiritimatiellota bacterium]
MHKTVIQILKNMLTGWGAVGLQAAIGLFMVPFLLGQLGRDGYGVIGILMSVIGFAEIADLGLRSALNRELSEMVALQDKAGFQRLSSSALVLYIGIALLIGGVGAAFAPALCSLFNVNDEYVGLMTLLLRTYAPLTVLISFVTPVFTAGISSFMRYDVQNNISMFAQLCISLMLFICLTVFDVNPLIIWCAVMVLGAVIRLGVMGLFYRKICYGGVLGMRHIYWGSLLPLFKLGGSMYVLQLTQMLAQRMDPLIISRYLGLGGVALYQAGSRLPQMVSPIVLAAVNQLTPLTTKYHVGDNWDREQQILILGTKYTLYLGAFFSAAMILFADSFCRLWLFDKLGEDVKTVSLVLKMWAVANLFNYAGGAHWPILLGKKRMKFAVWLNVPTAIFNVILSVFLVGYTELGIVGVLVGTVISECIRRPIAAVYVSKLVGVPFWRYVAKAYMFPVSYAALLLVTGWWSVGQHQVVSWSQLLAYGAVYCLLALGAILFFEHKIVLSSLNAGFRRSA